MEEEWRVTYLSPRHEVSNLGRVRSWVLRGSPKLDARAVQPKILKARLIKGGYRRLCIVSSSTKKKTTLGVHTLVLTAFVGPRPQGKESRHLNGNADDNRLENLVWGTKQENGADRRAHGRSRRPHLNNRGLRNGWALKDIGVIERILDAKGSDAFEVAARFGVEHKTVRKIWHGTHWSQLAGLAKM